jgi:hypothetical protein
MGATGWALVSAFCGALGVVLQQRGAMEAPPAGSGRGFVRSVVRNPVWLAGAAAQAACWATQGIALSKGRLALVQPIVSLQIVLALPLGIVITHQVVRRRDWLGAALVTIGILAFVVVSNPAPGRSNAPAGVWLAATAAVAAIVVVAAVAGARSHPATKAALFGTAAGVLFGLQAAVMNSFVTVVPDGLHAILSSWSTYGLIATALGAFYFMQAALQVGALAPAIATSNAAEPDHERHPRSRRLPRAAGPHDGRQDRLRHLGDPAARGDRGSLARRGSAARRDEAAGDGSRLKRPAPARGGRRHIHSST